MKNWILKGIRFLINGLKPHSNGDIFSRLIKYFFDIIKFISISIRAIDKIIMKIINIIICIKWLNLLIGS